MYYLIDTSHRSATVVGLVVAVTRDASAAIEKQAEEYVKAPRPLLIVGAGIRWKVDEWADADRLNRWYNQCKAPHSRRVTGSWSKP